MLLVWACYRLYTKQPIFYLGVKTIHTQAMEVQVVDSVSATSSTVSAVSTKAALPADVPAASVDAMGGVQDGKAVDAI